MNGRRHPRREVGTRRTEHERCRQASGGAL